MAVFVYRNGRMVNKETGEPMVSGDWRPTVPMIVPDIEPYLSPASGEYVSGRRAKRDDLKKNGCIDAGDLPTLGGKFKNKRFAAKRGLQVSEEYR